MFSKWWSFSDYLNIYCSLIFSFLACNYNIKEDKNKEGRMKKVLFSTLLIFLLSLTQIATAESPPKLNHKILKDILSIIYNEEHERYRYKAFWGVQELSNTHQVAFFLYEDVKGGKVRRVATSKAHIKYLTTDFRPRNNGWYLTLVEIGANTDVPFPDFYDHQMERIGKERLEKLKRRLKKSSS
jgi:hypothetical protein